MKRFSPQRLRAALEGHHVTRVAGEVGVSEGTLRNWVAGRAQPRADHLVRLAIVLGRTVEYFYEEGAA